jgi:hypothetical protein
MIEVRQGRQSCTILFEPSRVSGWAEYLVEDLWDPTAPRCKVNGAVFSVTHDGLLMDPGNHLVVVKPHRGLKIPWNRQLLFRKVERRVVVEFLCSQHSVAAA